MVGRVEISKRMVGVVVLVNSLHDGDDEQDHHDNATKKDEKMDDSRQQIKEVDSNSHDETKTGGDGSSSGGDGRREKVLALPLNDQERGGRGEAEGSPPQHYSVQTKKERPSGR